MFAGRTELREQTCKDFGYDLAIWRGFLLNNEEYGYTHPYAFDNVDRAIVLAIADETRRRLAQELEQEEQDQA